MESLFYNNNIYRSKWTKFKKCETVPFAQNSRCIARRGKLGNSYCNIIPDEYYHCMNRIAELRAEQKMTQAQLADLAGVSQATISRLESINEDSDLRQDTRLLGKIAKGLKVSLAELFPDCFSPRLKGEEFWAFCPNPMCEKNESGVYENGTPHVCWKSGSLYCSDDYDDVNYCTHCGTQLVKECPNCRKPLEERYPKFCIKCGHKICSRPTAEEWKLIQQHWETNKLKRSTGSLTEEDIPF